jgi:DNA-binding NarL/FixJ family response regulator
MIYQAISLVHGGDIYVTPAIGKLMVERAIKQEADKKAVDKSIIIYTQKQLEIIKRASRFEPYEQIAKEMNMGKRTVEGHCSKMFHQLEAKNFRAVIAYAERTGQLDGEEKG